MSPIKVIISGGGTGGHIFPAIAIANAIQVERPNAEILFVGAKGKMEMQRVPAAGYNIKGLWISGFQRRLTWKNLLFPIKLIVSWWTGRKIIRQFKPDVAIGVGGYASGPILKLANGAGVPTVLQEQNSYAGVTNRILGKSASLICVAYPNMESQFPNGKIQLTGNPVRKEFTQMSGKRERGIEHFGLDSSKKTLLVIGGSLGARTINHATQHMLDQLVRSDIQLVWQTGQSFADQAAALQEKYKGKGISIQPFIERMDLAYASADLVVSRAGAISVSELAVTGKATILVPSPNVAEDHQTKNAMTLVNHQAAVLVKDVEAVKELGKVVLDLIHNESKLELLSKQILSLAHRNAAEVIAQEVIKLIASKS